MFCVLLVLPPRCDSALDAGSMLLDVLASKTVSQINFFPLQITQSQEFCYRNRKWTQFMSEVNLEDLLVENPMSGVRREMFMRRGKVSFHVKHEEKKHIFV
jgi:hypothetical protein